MTMSKIYDYVFTLKGTQDMPYQNVRFEIIKISCILVFFYVFGKWMVWFIYIFLIKLVEINFFKVSRDMYAGKENILLIIERYQKIFVHWTAFLDLCVCNYKLNGVGTCYLKSWRLTFYMTNYLIFILNLHSQC